MSYDVATFTRLDINADGLGSVNIVLTYTGNAGERAIEEPVAVNLSALPTAHYVRAIAMRSMARLNRAASFVTGATPSIGATLDTTTALPADPVIGSYMAATGPFTPGTTAQDVLTITGSSTKTVTVTRMALTTIQTTAGSNAWAILKRSTANSGGTSSTVAGVPTSDAFPSATAVVRQYTANPTAGTLIGPVWTGRVPAPDILVSSGGLDRQVFGEPSQRPIVLTGVTNVLTWNFGGQTVPAGLSVTAGVWWTET